MNTALSKCLETHDLIEERCTLLKKCGPGKERINSRCVNIKKDPTIMLKEKVEKRKLNEETRLRKRAENLSIRLNTLVRNGNNSTNSTSKIKDALMRLRTQTRKVDINDLNENVTGMIGRIIQLIESKKTPKTRTPRRKREVGKNFLDEFNNFKEDLRLNSSPMEQENLNSPNSPTEQEKLNAYARSVSKMASMINFEKVNKMTKRARKPKATLKTRMVAGVNQPKRKMGTSLNRPSNSTRKKNSPSSNISL
jgi:hypothetical protein